MELTKGTVVSRRYRVKWLLREVPRGVFYQAIDQEDGDAVVLLKVCETEVSGTISDEDLAAREPELFKTLNHPSVATLRDSGEWGHRGRSLWFMAFDWISGENLAALLDRKGDLEVGDAFGIVLALMDALEYLHSEKHRWIALNLRPSCVWIDRSSETQPKPVIVDLGLAVPAGASELPECWDWEESFYLAPEVTNGLAHVRSDVFALAALLYKLVYGMPPWFVDEAPELFMQGKLAPALRKRRSTPLDLEHYDHPLLDNHFKKVMRKALAPDWETRFRNVPEFRDALRRDRKVTTQPPPRSGSSVLPKRPTAGRGFADVAGMDALKAVLQHDVIDALSERERYKEYGLAIPNGMLLYGPPGCGKTFIAQKFSEEIGCAVVHVTRSDIASIYIDGTVQKIRQLFDAAKETAPSILFLDEFDSLVPDRRHDMHQSSRTEVNEFLTQLQGLSEHEVFVIAATNRPKIIDPAVLRSGRIDKLVFVPPPDVEARQAMFGLLLGGRPTEVGIDDHTLAGLTEHFVASDIKLIVDESARRALRQKARISQGLLEQVIATQRPSISTEMIAEYEQMRQVFEDYGRGGDSASGKRPIGF